MEGQGARHRMPRAQLASERSVHIALSGVMDVLRDNNPTARQCCESRERLLRRAVYNMGTGMDLWHIDSA